MRDNPGMTARRADAVKPARLNDPGSGEQSRHRAKESTVDSIGCRPDLLGHIVGSRRLGFEQLQQQGSAGSPDVDFSPGFEKGVSRILAVLPFLLPALRSLFGGLTWPPFDAAFGGLHPLAMKASISAISQRQGAELVAWWDLARVGEPDHRAP